MCRSESEPGGPRRCPGDARAGYRRASVAVEQLEQAEAQLILELADLEIPAKVREAVDRGIPVKVTSDVADTIVAEAAAAARVAPFQVIEPGHPSLSTRYCATHVGKLGSRGPTAMGYGDSEEAARAHLAEVMAFNFAHNGSLM